MDLGCKRLSISFLILSLGYILTVLTAQFLYKKNEKLKAEIKTIKKNIDSLNNEIFVLELQLFRHERAYEIFEEKNPTASSQLGDIISDETE